MTRALCIRRLFRLNTKPTLATIFYRLLNLACVTKKNNRTLNGISILKLGTPRIRTHISFGQAPKKDFLGNHVPIIGTCNTISPLGLHNLLCWRMRISTWNIWNTVAPFYPSLVENLYPHLTIARFLRFQGFLGLSPFISLNSQQKSS